MDSDSDEDWVDADRDRRPYRNSTNPPAIENNGNTFYRDYEEWFTNGLEIERYEFMRNNQNGLEPRPFLYRDIHQTFNEETYTNESNIYKKGILRLKSVEDGVCIVPGTNEQERTEVQIKGRANCGQAFSDDTVYVKLHNSGDPSTDGKFYGEVVSFVSRKRYENITHPLLVCIKDRNQGHLMVPICKTLPKINVLHGRIAQNRLRTSVEIHRYIEQTRSLVFDRYKTVKEDEREDWLFIVVILKWKLTNIYPLGAVLDAVHISSDIEQGLTLISIQNRIPLCPEYARLGEIQVLRTNTPNDNYEDISQTYSVFTIGSHESNNISCGFSFNNLGQSKNVRLGVYVADVSRIVEKDSAIDNQAQKIGFSSSHKYGLPDHAMLPNEIDRFCSLKRGLMRHTLSVFIDLDRRGHVLSKALKRTRIKTSNHFTFQQVEDIINRTQQFDEYGFVGQDIMSLFSIAKNLRYDRLHHASFAAEMKLDFSENDNFMSTMNSRMLVNEILTLVNKVVRELLRNKFDIVPVFQSLPASGQVRDNLESWYSKYKNTMHLAVEFQNQPFMRLESFNLNRLKTRIRSYDDEHEEIDLLLQVSEKTLALVSGLLEQNRFPEAKQIICFDYLYPKQALALNEYHSQKPPSQYLMSNSEDEGCLVHFTSPLERYCDIIIQRFVHAYIDNTATPYSADEIHGIRNNLNKLMKQRHPFENQCESLCFAQYLNTKPVLFQCFVCSMTEEDFQILLPGFHQNSAKPLKIRFQDIKVCKIPEVPFLDEDECMVHMEYRETNDIENLENEKLNRLILRWRKRVYDYTKDTIPRPENIEDDGYIKLFPHQRSVLLKYELWKEILDNVFNKNNTALKNNVSSLLSPNANEEIGNDRYSLECFYDSVLDVSSETDSPLIIDHDVPFQMSLHTGQILSIQMSAREESAILTPIPQILNLTNNIKFCLPHVQEPIKTLLSYAERGSKKRYNSVQEYQSIWLPIVEMESTLNAVQDREPVVINNIPIKFKGRQGRFDIDQDFCDSRDLSFGYIPDVDDNDQGTIITERKIYHNISSADYLCIMFPHTLDQETRRRIGNKVLHEDDYFWSCHAFMTKLCKYFKIENDRGRQHRRAIIRVVFKLHEKSPSPPANGNRVCRMEVIFKSPVDKRLETNLKKLSYSSTLSQSICRGLDVDPVGREQFIVIDQIVFSRAGLNAGMSDNNQYQNEAIKQCLKRKFKLIQGPPGTGKTYVGVKLVYLFDKLNGLMAQRLSEQKMQIIFCGPSNKSVDLVARIVLSELGRSAPRIVRVYGGAYEQLDYPIPGRCFEARQNLHDSKADETLVDSGVVLHHIIRGEGKPYAARLNELDEQFKQDMQNRNTRDLQTTVEDIKEYKDLRSKAMKEELPNYDVIFCTTSMVANPKVAKATKDRIRQLIIDESGMCSEPSCICPIISTGAEQVVLIGDHKQLRPIVKCRDAAKLGLETSLFERYSSNRQYSTMLNIQYRMHPAICNFPSRRFYDGALITDSSTSRGYRPLSIWPTGRDTHYPHVFCHVEGEDKRLVVKTDAGNEQSRSNEDEVRHVARLFKYLVNEEGVGVKDINIMSQYNAQCTELRKAINNEGFDDFNVSTVVQSQGGEWNYVIFSLVRSLPVIEIPEQPTAGWCGQNLGFITDQNQINVALTRAKRGLIILGNTHLLRCDPVWKDLISDYRKKRCVFPAENFPVQN